MQQSIEGVESHAPDENSCNSKHGEHRNGYPLGQVLSPGREPRPDLLPAKSKSEQRCIEQDHHDEGKIPQGQRSTWKSGKKLHHPDGVKHEGPGQRRGQNIGAKLCVPTARPR